MEVAGVYGEHLLHLWASRIGSARLSPFTNKEHKAEPTAREMNKQMAEQMEQQSTGTPTAA